MMRLFDHQREALRVLEREMFEAPARETAAAADRERRIAALNAESRALVDDAERLISAGRWTLTDHRRTMARFDEIINAKKTIESEPVSDLDRWLFSRKART